MNETDKLTPGAQSIMDGLTTAILGCEKCRQLESDLKSAHDQLSSFYEDHLRIKSGAETIHAHLMDQLRDREKVIDELRAEKDAMNRAAMKPIFPKRQIPCRLGLHEWTKWVGVLFQDRECVHCGKSQIRHSKI